MCISVVDKLCTFVYNNKQTVNGFGGQHAPNFCFQSIIRADRCLRPSAHGTPERRQK